MRRIYLLVLCFGLCLGYAGASSAPTHLRVNYMRQPFGLDTLPRFSWLFNHLERAQQQTAFRILVSTNNSVDAGDIWDSGIIKSNSTVGVPFGGQPLVDDQTYYWTVQTWDLYGNSSSASEVAQFHTGFIVGNFSQSAKWIGGYNQLRREFTLSGPADQATAFVCGLGYYELFVNGEKIGKSKLDPGWTTYVNRSLYVVHDIKNYLRPGRNAIGVMLGNGWWGQTAGWGKNRTLLFQLNINQDPFLFSDNSWKGIQGPIVFDGVYDGEIYDSSMETPGWTQPIFDDSNWHTATSPPDAPVNATLRAQVFPPIRIDTCLQAVNITNPLKGMYVFDFGQNMAGICRLKVEGLPAGINVTLRHAEVLYSNGTIYTANLRSAKATDIYMTSQNSSKYYEPTFTYHGFRFVELTGYPTSPSPDTLIACHLHSSVANTGFISFHPHILNQLQSNIIWGQRSNLMSAPTDCDQRDERLGWTADAHLSSMEAMHNFDMAAFYENWLQDLNDDQKNGEIPDTSPFVRYGSRPGDPSWSSAYPIVMYNMWKSYNDVFVIQNHWKSLKDYFVQLLTVYNHSAANFYYYYGDWVPPPPALKCNGSLTSTFYLMYSLRLAAEMADAVGNLPDRQFYTHQYESVMKDFNTAFFDQNTNMYDIGVQTCMVLPLSQGIVPRQSLFSVQSNLMNDIVNIEDEHLSTGILGTRFLPYALSDMSRTDMALHMAMDTTYPSWGYMIYQQSEAPATTLWELWDSPFEGPGMNSRNHIMFGSVGAWFYTHLLGVGQRHDSAGFKHVIIRPPPNSVIVHTELVSVQGIVKTVGGDIVASWSRNGGLMCSSAPHTGKVKLACPGSKIGKILFASYGTASGKCLDISVNPNCHAKNSMEKVESCIGQEHCVIDVKHQDYVLPSMEGCQFGQPKLSVVAECEEPNMSFQLMSKIPANSIGDFHIPTLGFSSTSLLITESGSPIWQNGMYVPGVDGIFGAYKMGDYIVVNSGSGSYAFDVSGSFNNKITAVARKGEILQLKCENAQEKISTIHFASFGTPKRIFDIENRFSENLFSIHKDCHFGSSRHVAESLCLNQNECVVDIRNDVRITSLFGSNYECEKDLRLTFVIEASCA